MSVQILVTSVAPCDDAALERINTDTPINVFFDGSHRRSERMQSNILKLGVHRALWAAIVVALCASPGFAQTTGRLVGTIVDAQGAVLPGVTVTVTSPQLQGANTQITDANGQFRFPSLPPGAYHVKAELGGFKSV